MTYIDNFFKLNYDASVKGNGLIDFSFVWQDFNGKILGAGYEVECTEILVVTKGQQFVKNTSFMMLIVENDHQTVINHLSSHSLNNSYEGLMYGDCLQLASSFESISYSFVYRSENSMAHGLTSLAQLNSLSFFIYWLEDIYYSVLLFCKQWYCWWIWFSVRFWAIFVQKKKERKN